ncbi:unnamed protein product [Ilex paraguariensis]|uniref:Small ribosomal subunit protein uS14m n=1 Tax=Ilex paraguariensis TaxID=185542 RepID=A0ABC8TZ39_9AQUA
MSEKRNIRDHKRRLLAAKYELRRKLYKAFCKDPDLPSDMRDKHRYKLSKLPRNSSFARGAAKPNSIKARGLTFPDAESSYSNLAMLMEQENFFDDMDPKRCVRTPNCLGVALCPAWWTKSSLLLE